MGFTDLDKEKTKNCKRKAKVLNSLLGDKTMQATKPLTIDDVSNHVYFLDLDDMKNWTEEESAKLTERFIDTFGEQDNGTS